MLAEGYNCRAVEHSPQMVAAARATLRKRKVGQPLWVIQGSAQSLPFPDSTFDTVVSTFPSDYISDCDRTKSLAVLGRKD
jgi:ubiquinone/menaquinone biosynthesis C-methylase UbiE